MRFDDFDKKMRVYEESIDQFLLPDTYVVVRLDGRSFSNLTKNVCKFEVPFDEKFRDLMVNTMQKLMTDSGFRFLYGYTESDEISLLMHPDDNTFNRKVRKLNSILAGEASAAFTMALGIPVVFDCRVVPLPNVDRVGDYFVWRQEDSHRNSMNGYCYWTLRKEGNSRLSASNMLNGKGMEFKNELLFNRGINYNNLPTWQKRGIGAYFKNVKREGYNPITKETVITDRKELVTDYEIPLGEKYRDFVISFLK